MKKKNQVFLACQESWGFNMQDLVRLWRHISQPFTLPEGIHHCRHEDYESIDCDMAGCVKCGSIHRCKDDGTCPMEVYEGRHVCRITGYYTRRNVFTDDEFVDTVGQVSMLYSKPVKFIDETLIRKWVCTFLCSQEARRSLENEIMKKKSRVQSVFAKLARQNTGLSIPALITAAFNSVASMRTPLLLAEEDLERLAAECINRIDHLCGTLVFSNDIALQVSKMHGIVVGLLYLMRVGVILHGDIEVIPRIHLLTRVLPTESHMKAVFKCSTKFLTGTENLVKMSLRCHDRQKLICMGFKQI